MIDYTIFYIINLPIPLCFIVYGVLRIYRHWSDGKSRKGSFSKYQLLKYALTIIQASGNLGIIVFSILTRTYISESSKEEALKFVYFSLSCTSWIVSCSLCYFEYVRQMRMKWLGHRIYWPIKFVINSIFILQLVLNDESTDESIIFLLIYCIFTFTSFILCILAIFLPNNFMYEGYRGGSKSGMYNIITDGENKFIFSFYTESHKPLLSIHVTNYKIKPDHDKNTIYYTILTKYEENSFISKRSYLEFHFLNVNLRNKVFPVRNSSFPHFPVFMSTHIPIDKKMEELTNYLSDLSRLDIIDEELLEFLNIEGKTREILLSELGHRSRKTFSNGDIPVFSPKNKSRESSAEYNHIIKS